MVAFIPAKLAVELERQIARLIVGPGLRGGRVEDMMLRSARAGSHVLESFHTEPLTPGDSTFRQGLMGRIGLQHAAAHTPYYIGMMQEQIGNY